ncbi:MAG: helix-turn-helix transcriptional regulator [Eubacteriales bacterium]|nr:helix-turn-helix transcriptional regulator [Eubacteriales bacterium]
MMENYNTFAETEALLLTAIELPGNSIKEIAAATGIKPNTLYKWKSSGKTHLSPKKADKLLLYFIQNEPERLDFAESLQSGTLSDYKKNNTSVLSSLNRGNDTEE